MVDSIKEKMLKKFNTSMDKLAQRAAMDIPADGWLTMPNIGDKYTIMPMRIPKEREIEAEGEKRTLFVVPVQVTGNKELLMCYGMQDGDIREMTISSGLFQNMVIELLKRKYAIDNELECFIGKKFILKGKEWKDTKKSKVPEDIRKKFEDKGMKPRTVTVTLEGFDVPVEDITDEENVVTTTVEESIITTTVAE